MPNDDQDSGVSSLPVDPTTGVPVLTIGPPASNPLPVEQQPIYDPYTGVSLNQDASVTDTGPIAKLFGLAGNDRYQLWPERVVRSALSAPADALAGKFGTVQPTNGSISDEDVAAAQASSQQEIPRALDVASLAGGGALTEPVAAAPVSDSVGTIAPLLKEFDMAAQPVLRSDTTQPAAAIDAAANVPTFYSAVENAVNNASIKSASPQQWLGTIQNAKGVKPEELQWTGLQDWLADQPGPVSKDQVQDFVAGNKVQLQEVNKGNQTLTGLPEGFNAVKTGGTYGIKGPDNRFYGIGFQSEQDAIDAFLKHGSADYNPNPTKHSKWQLPGADPGSYREMLMTLPTKNQKYNEFSQQLRNKYGDKSFSKMSLTKEENLKLEDLMESSINETDEGIGKYKSSHWDEPNVLAHVRMNDRTIDGQKVLHLEEIQSDWHQQGRQQGYKITDAQKAKLEDIDNKLVNGLSEGDIGNPDMPTVLKTAIDKKVITPEEATNYAQWSKGENSNIPDAPFKKSWLELAAKRMIREAAEKGYQKLSWTPGEAQAARYDLSKQISKIEYQKGGSSGFTPYNEVDKNEGGTLTARDHNGNAVISQYARDDELPDIIGKEIADRLLKSKGNNGKHAGITTVDRKLEGLDLKIGGEGMHEFYDKMLPRVLEKIGKDYGVKVKDGKLSGHKDDYVLENRYGHTSRGGSSLEEAQQELQRKKVALDQNDWQIKDNRKPFKYIDLPQGLKDVAMKKGFPLFSSGMMISPPIDNKAADKLGLGKPKFKLTKVQGNPFNGK